MSNKALEHITATSIGLKTIILKKKHQIILDEPVDFGGKDTGMNPLAALLASLAGCENVIANMVAKEMNFTFHGIDFDIEGEFDPKGLMGDPNVRPYFQTIVIKTKVKTDESYERIKELQERTQERCPIFRTLEAAGIILETQWTKV